MWLQRCHRAAQVVLDIVAPLRCPLCGGLLVERVACPACALPLAARVRRILAQDGHGPYLVLSGGIFAGRWRQVVHAFKYGQDPGALRLIAAQMAHAIPQGLTWDYLVPVPAHRVRVRERGFDVTATLARELTRLVPLPLARPLQRPMYTVALTGLRGLERRRVLEGTLRAQRSRGRLLLVDDVTTTGATFRACRRQLLGAGAASVDLLAAGRTPRPALGIVGP